MKTIQKITLIFGIVFLVFSGLAALITYQIDKLMYSSAAPASFIELGILQSMLPFLAFAAVSFVAMGLIWGQTKPTAETELETEKQPAQETDIDKQDEKEMDAT